MHALVTRRAHAVHTLLRLPWLLKITRQGKDITPVESYVKERRVTEIARQS